MSIQDMSMHDISKNDIVKEKTMEEKLRKKYCPMTETTFYTLLALIHPNHGYGIMKFVRELTEERVKMGTGTLYTMLGRLVEDSIIKVINEDDGKKTYQITDVGRMILVTEQGRLKKQCENGERIIGKLYEQ
jgi:DNA-binding PadR family transcriptional regulator